MSFLKENSQNLAMASISPLSVGEELGRTRKHIVHAIGSTQNKLELALKEPISNRSSPDIDYIHYQIALLKFLYDTFPARRVQLPKLYGLLKTHNGRVGIIMDRFTGDNIHDVDWNDDEVYQLQQDLEMKGLPKINADYIYPSLFRTRDGIRIGDLLMLARQSIVSTNPSDLQKKLHTTATILNRCPRTYTIQINTL